MATKTLTGFYEYYRDAVQTVQDLEAAGIRRSDISIITSSGDNRHYRGSRRTTWRGSVAFHASEDAKMGTAVGGGIGLLSGLGLLALPGLAPIAATGWLAPTVIGALTGALVGGLVGAIIGAIVGNSDSTEDYALMYADGIRRGGSLVAVRVSKKRYQEVADIMARHQPGEAAESYGRSTWAGFADTAVRPEDIDAPVEEIEPEDEDYETTVSR
jgi:hypothetical protein